MSPSTPPDESVSSADALDRMLRPDPRADLVERIRRLLTALDRRLIVVVAVVGALAFGGWALLVRSAEPAELTLPSAADPNVARSGDGASTAGGPPSGATGAPAAGSPTSTIATAEVVVHVAGAVMQPGLLRLPTGSRVADAIAAAGGPTPDADIDRLNLAQPVADGSRVVVGRIGEAAVGDSAPGVTPPAGAGAGAGGEATPASPIDLNTADLAQLEELPGVGPSTAKAIIDHREANGPFRSVDDLLDVRGIGPAKLEALRALAVVDGS